MERESFVALVDLGLGIAKQTAASTETPHDDTLVRFMEFGRGDQSFEQFLDWKFGNDAPLSDDPQSAAVLAIAEDQDAAEVGHLRDSAGRFGRTENLSAEQIAGLFAAAKAIFQAIKLFRQQKQQPAAG